MWRDLAAVCAAVARVLAPGGLFGFTVETHDGEGAIVGAKLRYAHSADFVRGAIADAGPDAAGIDEPRRPAPRTAFRFPGLLVVAQR